MVQVGWVCVIDIFENQIGGRAGVTVSVKGLKVVVCVGALDKRDILVQAEQDLLARHKANGHEAHCDTGNDHLGDWVEKCGHIMFLELSARPFLPGGLNFCLLGEAADDITAASLDALVIKG